jgi:hypothetical protein
VMFDMSKLSASSSWDQLYCGFDVPCNCLPSTVRATSKRTVVSTIAAVWSPTCVTSDGTTTLAAEKSRYPTTEAAKTSNLSWPVDKQPDVPDENSLVVLDTVCLIEARCALLVAQHQSTPPPSCLDGDVRSIVSK